MHFEIWIVATIAYMGQTPLPLTLGNPEAATAKQGHTAHARRLELDGGFRVLLKHTTTMPLAFRTANWKLNTYTTCFEFVSQQEDANHFQYRGDAVVERLDCSPPIKTNWVLIPGRVTPEFLQVEIVPDDAAYRQVFLGISVSPTFAFRRCSILSSFHLHLLSRPRWPGVVWTNRTMVSSNTDTNGTGVLAVVDIELDSRLISLTACQGKLAASFTSQACYKLDLWRLVSKSRILFKRVCLHIRLDASLQPCTDKFDSSLSQAHYAIGGAIHCVLKAPFTSRIHPRTERRWNARAGETGVPRENQPASGIVQHDSHMRQSGSEPAGDRTRIAVVGGESSSRLWRDCGVLRHSRQMLYLLVLAYHQGELGSIPVRVIPGFSHVGIMPDDAAGRRVFSGISRFLRPFVPALLHTHLISPSSVLKTSLLRAAQISSLTHLFTVTMVAEAGSCRSRFKTKNAELQYMEVRSKIITGKECCHKGTTEACVQYGIGKAVSIHCPTIYERRQARLVASSTAMNEQTSCQVYAIRLRGREMLDAVQVLGCSSWTPPRQPAGNWGLRALRPTLKNLSACASARDATRSFPRQHLRLGRVTGRRPLPAYKASSPGTALLSALQILLGPQQKKKRGGGRTFAPEQRNANKTPLHLNTSYSENNTVHYKKTTRSLASKTNMFGSAARKTSKGGAGAYGCVNLC
ncbi:hypothetical protein PR048_000685 [Dryococelus australis]|uniref:Uncharacterized protein n=1 Tax=Dryococelus australis TaxID=614101 RepID=A0ABQ9IFA3_9NEOP|nr:hypothetical protein PR048_000685 [Dryococelus australis]